MKSFLFTVSALALSALGAAAFELPRGIHDLASLDEARAKASERPEPVSFVITRKSMKET